MQIMLLLFTSGQIKVEFPEAPDVYVENFRKIWRVSANTFLIRECCHALLCSCDMDCRTALYICWYQSSCSVPCNTLALHFGVPTAAF
jgi:hypothetical protein